MCFEILWRWGQNNVCIDCSGLTWVSALSPTVVIIKFLIVAISRAAIYDCASESALGVFLSTRINCMTAASFATILPKAICSPLVIKL